MDRDVILERLRAQEPELRRLGISRLSLFGSVARGEAKAGSDVDLAAEFDRAGRSGCSDSSRSRNGCGSCSG